ncbi:hypothetical protein BJ165DRAFT_1409495 [Panaeolus papilionaceus]|nr:hypothetical protein BJ165DRAFT_1409495 [Panaeolus papilionaceus]
MDLDQFMQGMQSSSPALQLLRDRITNSRASPYLFCANSALPIMESYHFRVTGVDLPGFEYHLTDPSTSHLEFRATLFGTVCNCGLGGIHEILQIALPVNASQSMVVAFNNQVNQLRAFGNRIAAGFQTIPPVFPTSASPFYPSFEVTQKSFHDDPSPLEEHEVVTDNNNPYFPPDNLYNIDQQLCPMCLAYQYLTPNTVALFDGTLKYYPVSDKPMGFYFLANEIRVIARNSTVVN